MSTLKLVILDERDYKNLVHPSPAPQEPTTPSKQDEIPAPPSPTPLPPTPPPLQPLQEPATQIDPAVEEEKSPLEKLIDELPPSAKPCALDLLGKLAEIPAFDYDERTGGILVAGKEVEGNYTISRFLRATCRPSARVDVPRSLLLFLKDHGVAKFRNKKIKSPRPQWRSLYSFPGSTTVAQPVLSEVPRRYTSRRAPKD